MSITKAIFKLEYVPFYIKFQDNNWRKEFSVENHEKAHFFFLQMKVWSCFRKGRHYGTASQVLLGMPTSHIQVSVSSPACSVLPNHLLRGSRWDASTWIPAAFVGNVNELWLKYLDSCHASTRPRWNSVSCIQPGIASVARVIQGIKELIDWSLSISLSPSPSFSITLPIKYMHLK